MNKKQIVLFCITVGLTTMLALNFNFLRDFFLSTRDPNKLIMHTLQIKNSKGQTESVVFNVPDGYFVSHVRREGESFVLYVAYPDRAFVTQDMFLAQNRRDLKIFISARDITVGDQLKSAIDDGTLQQRFGRIVLATNDPYIILKELKTGSEERNDISKLFYDKERLHWIRNRLSYMTLSEGEGMMKNLPVFLEYTYGENLETDPRVMHEWVMNFIDSLQVNNVQTPQGK